MKKLFLLSFPVFILLFAACEGPTGPPGPAGPVGESHLNDVFEIEVDFTTENNYEVLLELDPVIPEDYVVLVYLEWSYEDEISLWKLLPQTVYFEDSELQYNFDFTSFDINLFLDGTVDFTTLSADYTHDQYFRIVLVPGRLAGGRVDFSNYEAVMEMLGKTESDVKTLPLKQ